MAACDALIVTAVEEPFGRTLIEAMLLRTPVVAANSGGNPEAIRHGETGLLAPADDPEAFAGMTLGLFQNPAKELSHAETRSEEGRVGKEGVRKSRYRWSQKHK